MKKQLFGLICAAVFVFASVPFAGTAAADDTASDSLVQGKTPDGTYDWAVFQEYGQGEISFDGAETEGGGFSCKWDGIRSCSFSKGHNVETPDTPFTELGALECDYTLKYSADGISKFGVHGWLKDLRDGFREFPLVEYFIIDGYTAWRPCEDEEPLGQVTDNGCTYDIYAVYHAMPSADMSAQFLAQYFSIIAAEDNPVEVGKPAETAHRIDISRHFAAWKDAGLYMDGAVLNVEFCVDCWECSGEAAVQQRLGEKADLPPEGTVPPETDCVKGDVNGDHECTGADAVLLQKSLLTMDDTSLPNPPAADRNGDGILSAADLSAVKQEILNSGT